MAAIIHPNRRPFKARFKKSGTCQALECVRASEHDRVWGILKSDA